MRQCAAITTQFHFAYKQDLIKIELYPHKTLSWHRIKGSDYDCMGVLDLEHQVCFKYVFVKIFHLHVTLKLCKNIRAVMQIYYNEHFVDDVVVTMYNTCRQGYLGLQS